MAKEERDGEWGHIVRHYHIKQRTTEAYSPWQNRAESAVRELKKLLSRALRKSGAPTELWYYAMEWAARVMSLTAHGLPALKTRTLEEALTGQTPDTLSSPIILSLSGFGTGTCGATLFPAFVWAGGLALLRMWGSQ